VLRLVESTRDSTGELERQEGGNHPEQLCGKTGMSRTGCAK
jgi:hypothetical protein